MDNISELKLSAELQELYLQNKDWMSQVLFLADESRFFQKLFGQRLFLIGKNHTAKQIDLISVSLANLEKRDHQLKHLVDQHRHLLETIFKGENQSIGLELIEQHEAIKTELNRLLHVDRLLRTELFSMVEGTKE
jgi:hypothetical protein